jgi:DNA polymerase V
MDSTHTPKKKRGGKRPNAGRKPGTGLYGEKTTVIRVPQSALKEIKSMLLTFPKCPQVEPGRMKVEALFHPTHNSAFKAPLYASRIAAGLPVSVGDEEDGLLDLNKHVSSDPQSTFYVRVNGDSMIDVGIHPGDLLVVNRSLRPYSGKIVIAVVNGELTVKRLFKEKDRLFLMPENPHYPAIEISQDMDFMIWGVVTNVIHAL